MTRRFNVPPNWPEPPVGWNPPPGWEPSGPYPPPPEGWQLWVDDHSGRTRWLRAGAGAVWLLLLLVTVASGDLAAFLAMLGLPLAGIGLVAVALGHLRWARLTRPGRVAGAVALGTGLVLVVAGGVAGARSAPAPARSAPQPASQAASQAAQPGGGPAATSATPLPTPTPTHQVVEVRGVPSPDPAVTPGSTVPGATLARVCAPSWLLQDTGVSPTTTDEVFASYGIADSERSGYQLDRLVPAGLGGDVTAANLWPEPLGPGSTTGAAAKDALEAHLRALVCAHQVPLATAQHGIASNWGASYARYMHVAVAAPATHRPPAAPATRAPRPAPPVAPAPPAPPAPPVVTPPPVLAGVTAVCVDGSLSYSQHRRGTCSHHGGVARWINRPPS